MMNRMFTVIIIGCLGVAPLQAQEETPPGEDPAHDEIRAMRDAIVEAANSGDLDTMLSHVHENVVGTWQNAETNRGREGLRSFHENMMMGEDPVVENITHDLKVDELSILYGGDTAIAFGGLDEVYELTDGTQFDLHSRWTATMVKEEDRWLVAAFHISANLFDNPLLTVAKRALYWVGTLAFAIGLGLGVVGTAVVTKRRRQKA